MLDIDSPLQAVKTLIPAPPAPSASNPQRPEPPASAPYPAKVPAAVLRARKARPEQFDSVVEAARSAARSALAPTGHDLEALLIRIPHESAKHQAKARRNQERARQEFFKRLEGVQVEQGGRQVVVSRVTTREVIRMLEAESNLIKSEALAQRSYAVHQSIAGPVTQGPAWQWKTLSPRSTRRRPRARRPGLGVSKPGTRHSLQGTPHRARRWSSVASQV